MKYNLAGLLMGALLLTACQAPADRPEATSSPTPSGTRSTPPLAVEPTQAPRPVESFTASLSVQDGRTYGVGMIPSLTFSKPVQDTAAVRGAVKVESTGAQEIRAHWFGTQRLDFRPATYWTPGDVVTVSGATVEPVRFTIGRSQVSTVDAAAKTMTVKTDGKVSSAVPITTGSNEHPTYNGAMVVSEMFDTVHMDAKSVGIFKPSEVDEEGRPVPAYDIPDVPNAIRLTQSGTFLHGNYWKPKSILGKENTSAGCIGLSDLKPDETEAGFQKKDGTQAKGFFDSTMVGDVVEVVNSNDATVRPDNGLNSWNLSWDRWS
ncbi:Ig-like domain-containing protein [Streptomyces sp. NPDC127112]|uniref:L,D-transpeptidase n=1 Tax=Streptomyces sp. NPDC127112 TaxID=3345364 RepID=UPI0036345E93